MKVLSDDSARGKEHPVDRHYKELKCQLSPVDSEDLTFALMAKYMTQTHASTHRQYKMTLVDLFEVDRKGEGEAFRDVGNR